MTRLLPRAVTGAVRGPYVEASTDGPPPARMLWRCPRERADAVAEQVARQLALGYERILPHGATFVGFG